MKELDDLDRQIIVALKENARIKNTELALLLGVNEATIRNRIKKLEQEGIIMGYTVQLGEMIHQIEAYLWIDVQSGTNISDMAEKIIILPEVEHVSELAGKPDLIVKLTCRTTNQLNKIIDAIRNIQGVKETKTSIILKQYRLKKKKTENPAKMIPSHRD